MDDEIAWEHKLANADLFRRRAVGAIRRRTDGDGTADIDHGRPACPCSWSLTARRTSHTPAWYDGDPALRAKIAGWKRFARRRGRLRPQEVIPAPVVAAPDELPAPCWWIWSAVRSTNRLATWQQAVTARIRAINTDHETDGFRCRRRPSVLDDRKKL